MNCDQSAANRAVKLPDGAWVEEENQTAFLISKNWPLISDEGFRKKCKLKNTRGLFTFF